MSDEILAQLLNEIDEAVREGAHDRIPRILSKAPDSEAEKFLKGLTATLLELESFGKAWRERKLELGIDPYKLPD